ncbi:hypothetical protein ADK75_07340 [Streptomyces virginiae]|uniref:Protein kinase domain-containing protein n=1 Tax=Streptomyces virginiae TaxID=1961 RepID=A0A0L8N1M7_STRVG|nr:class IV lanthionine synthetase LanL [Streptomyces virginiae]KOG56577.1 hypothetical protein ADK75_07340 [Streptomyces virginiae]
MTHWDADREYREFNRFLLQDVVRGLLERSGCGDWDIAPGEFWCYVRPSENGARDQGWKLHISATPASAHLVLSQAAAVLIKHQASFKFARDMETLETLLSRETPRGSGGKFITVYPSDDDQFRLLAGELDRATEGLSGPRILSDREVRPGSIVQYRYGVFSAARVFRNDGMWESCLRAPDGSFTADDRPARFSPPSWAPLPLPGSDRSGSAHPAAVMLAGRFLVRAALKQSYGRNVYRAEDTNTGGEVIIKQVRRDTGGRNGTNDSRSVLHHEGEMLDLLRSSGLAPAKIALFEQQGDLFLAEEFIAGSDLRVWARARAVQTQGGLTVPAAVKLADQLIQLLAEVHALSLVARDFNPKNIIVTPGGELKLVDVEALARKGDRVFRVFTPFYAPSEQTSVPRGVLREAPGPAVDVFALGATLFYLATGCDPIFPDDAPVERPFHDRLASLISAMSTDIAALHALAPLILALVREDPEERWTLDQARGFLLQIHDTSERSVRPTQDQASPEFQQRVLDDGLEHIVGSMTPQGTRLWPAVGIGAASDPLNVQYGAAGVLAVLVRAAQLPDGERLRGVVKKAAGWIEERRMDIPHLLPGLYFGRAGTAWALFDAARYLEDAAMERRALELAAALPVPWPNPDIGHGTAGAGMAMIHLWQATGRQEFEVRIRQCADAVLGCAEIRGGETVWPIPKDFDSRLAGTIHYGFAHGVAGAGAFLLAAGHATGHKAYTEAARAAAETLVASAVVHDGAARWPISPQDSGAATPQHWCSGASGIATFLIRLWQDSQDEKLLALCRQAAVTVHRDRWRSGSSVCHGLAGDGDFLLDLFDLTGDTEYQAWAQDIAAVLYTRHSVEQGLIVLPGEDPMSTTAAYSTGSSGVLGFLLRLRHGGPRWWMAHARATGS